MKTDPLQKYRDVYQEVLYKLRQDSLFIDNFSQGIVYGYALGKGMTQQEAEKLMAMFVLEYDDLKRTFKKGDGGLNLISDKDYVAIRGDEEQQKKPFESVLLKIAEEEERSSCGAPLAQDGEEQRDIDQAWLYR